MAQHKTDPSIRFLAQMAVTTVLWAGTFFLTKSDSFGHPVTVPARLALVAVGLGGFVPVIFLYAKSIRMQDEFNQRIHYIALSIAFATIAVVSYAADLLYQAGFIPYLPATGLWALMTIVWFIAMLVTPRFYR